MPDGHHFVGWKRFAREACFHPTKWSLPAIRAHLLLWVYQMVRG